MMYIKKYRAIISIGKPFNKIIPMLVSLFNNLSLKIAVSIILLLIIIGQVIHFFYALKHFHAYQIISLTSIIIAFWAIRKFLVGFNKFKQMTASQPIKFISINILKLINSKWSISGILVIGGLFIYLFNYSIFS